VQRLFKMAAAIGAGLLVALAGAAAAYADEGPTIVIDGREYGAAEGLVIDTEQFEVQPGGDPVGEYFGDPYSRATWGASYAISEEIAWLWYRGTAKAAANVYSGLRIVQVCFWYTRNGTAISNTYCSNASTNGSSWSPGTEVAATVADTLDPNAPHTIFNIQTSRIDPHIV